MSALNVAYVFNCSFLMGGGEISFAELIRVLDTSAVSPVVLVPAEGEISEISRKAGNQVLISPLPSLREFQRGELIKHLRQLVRGLRNSGVQILHANGSRACFYCILAGRSLQIPVLWHVRETIRDLFLYDGLLAYGSTGIICASESIERKRLYRFGPPVRRKTVVVHNGVDTLKFQRLSEAREKTRGDWGVSKDEVLFGVVGNFVSHKRQDFFLNAFAKAVRVSPDLPARLILVGRRTSQPFYEKLQSLVRELDLIRRVRFLEYTDWIVDLLSGLDVLVLPSEREGFSRSIIEGMACSLPILATRIPEIEEAVVHGKTGLLFDRNDTDAAASAIIDLSRNADMRISLGATGRAVALEKLSLVRHARAIESVYRKIIGHDQPGSCWS